MAFFPRVERWRPQVIAELQRGYPWPPELVLALMQRESGGKPGIVNETSGASGLMQIMPGTLRTFNQNTGSNVPLSTMRDTGAGAVPIQIRVGLWVLGRYWKLCYKWLSTENQSTDIPIDELMKFGDAFYHAGPTGMKNLSRNLPRPVKWADWASRHPRSKITIHADAIWAKTVANNPSWNMAAIDSYVSGGNGQVDPDPIIIPDPDPEPVDPKIGLMIGLLILAAAAYWMKKK